MLSKYAVQQSAACGVSASVRDSAHCSRLHVMSRGLCYMSREVQS